MATKLFRLKIIKRRKRIRKPVTWQTGRTNILIDKKRKALPPGWRISKSGKTYYEARKNRSDLNPERRI